MALVAGCHAAPRGPAPSGTPVANAHPALTRPAPAPLRLTGPIVALGDSYTAGDLLPVSLASHPPGCLRSSRGYAVQVAKALGVSGRLVDVACTGAGVKEMTSAQRTYLGTNPPQFSVLGRDDSLVMLTLGGDDMGWLKVIDTCMALSVTSLHGSPCERHYTGGGADQLAGRVAAESARLTAVLNRIRALAPRAKVVLVGYPDLVPQGSGCWPVVPITDGDIAYLRGIETRLNTMLAVAATAAGATFVDTYTPTIGHDFCLNSQARDFEGLIPGSFAVPFHPNARGQDAMAAAVLAELRGGQGGNQPQAVG